MDEVHVGIVVVNLRTGARSEEITALADTGATLTVIPAEVLQRLGIQKLRPIALVLADGRRAERDVGEAAEQLGLAVDPVQRRLVRTDFLLY